MLGDISKAEHIYIAVGYTDMRKQIDGLSALVTTQFRLDPFSNSVFLFCGRNARVMKTLYWEGGGFVLLYKRLENSRFKWPRDESEAREITPSSSGASDTLSYTGLKKIAKLFAIEKEIDTFPPEDKVKIRQERSKPLVDDFFSWCKDNQNKVLTASKTGKAIQYALNYEAGLRSFLEDVLVPMTNSLDERTIRPFTRASAIMKKMQITAQLPKKDAYKGQATHHHECMAKPNLVNRNFKLGVRQVILTDITYIHYGYNRTPAYMCAFKDAYTTEILGHYVSGRMDVSLVQQAFNNMMENHKDEFPKNLEVYCHSDQGSQYLSTSFKQLLNENDFIQSMSRRGNSQDNAPMESFFGRMKTEVIDIIARCGDIATVRRLIDGYINMHNNERYQDTLAALSPNEFYTYKVTGQYPLDSYYGVKASELMPLDKIIEAKLEMQEKKKKLRKERQKINEQQSRLLRNAGEIIMRDMKKMKDENKKWVEQQKLVEDKLKKISEIIEKISKALKFYYYEATAEIKKLLKDPLNWKNYTELDYYKDLDALY